MGCCWPGVTSVPGARVRGVSPELSRAVPAGLLLEDLKHGKS